MAETHVERAAPGLDHGFVADLAERWEAAWNSHQPDRLLELMTEDIVYDDSGWPRTMRGHGDVREFLESTWRAMPDLEFQMVEGPFVLRGQAKAAFYWRGAGTFTGRLDPPGFSPTGARITFEGFDLHEYRNRRVCRLRIVFDMMDAGRQIGVVPRPGSRIRMEKRAPLCNEQACAREGVSGAKHADRARARRPPSTSALPPTVRPTAPLCAKAEAWPATLRSGRCVAWGEQSRKLELPYPRAAGAVRGTLPRQQGRK